MVKRERGKQTCPVKGPTLSVQVHPNGLLCIRGLISEGAEEEVAVVELDNGCGNARMSRGASVPMGEVPFGDGYVRPCFTGVAADGEAGGRYVL